MFGILRCIAVLSLLEPELLSLSQSDCHHGGAADARNSRVKRTRRHIPSLHHLLLSEIGERKTLSSVTASIILSLVSPARTSHASSVSAGLCGVNRTGDDPASIIWFYWIIAVWRAKWTFITAEWSLQCVSGLPDTEYNREVKAADRSCVSARSAPRTAPELRGPWALPASLSASSRHAHTLTHSSHLSAGDHSTEDTRGGRQRTRWSIFSGNDRGSVTAHSAELNVHVTRLNVKEFICKPPLVFLTTCLDVFRVLPLKLFSPSITGLCDQEVALVVWSGLSGVAQKERPLNNVNQVVSLSASINSPVALCVFQYFYTKVHTFMSKDWGASKEWIRNNWVVDNNICMDLKIKEICIIKEYFP